MGKKFMEEDTNYFVHLVCRELDESVFSHNALWLNLFRAYMDTGKFNAARLLLEENMDTLSKDLEDLITSESLDEELIINTVKQYSDCYKLYSVIMVELINKQENNGK